MEEINKTKDCLVISKEMALLELFIAKIDVLIRESPSDEILISHCLFRLHELRLIAKECVKGLDLGLKKQKTLNG